MIKGILIAAACAAAGALIALAYFAGQASTQQPAQPAPQSTTLYRPVTSVMQTAPGWFNSDGKLWNCQRVNQLAASNGGMYETTDPIMGKLAVSIPDQVVMACEVAS